jgi:hypothetical protein
MSTSARVLETPDTERPRLRLVEPNAAAQPIVSMRTCTSCGEYTAFVTTDAAGWSACTACGNEA